MNKGKYVFSQVMTYFPRWVFEAAVEKYNGDFHAKNLTSYSHCLHLMFGQLAGCKSLKDITLVLRSIKKAAYHLGIPTVVDPSSLSKANEIRDRMTELTNCTVEYNDSAVRQMIECINVHANGRLDIIFAGGLRLEEQVPVL